jgi:hypothetical protein
VEKGCILAALVRQTGPERYYATPRDITPRDIATLETIVLALALLGIKGATSNLR